MKKLLLFSLIFLFLLGISVFSQTEIDYFERADNITGWGNDWLIWWDAGPNTWNVTDGVAYWSVVQNANIYRDHSSWTERDVMFDGVIDQKSVFCFNQSGTTYLGVGGVCIRYLNNNWDFYTDANDNGNFVENLIENTWYRVRYAYNGSHQLLKTWDWQAGASEPASWEATIVAAASASGKMFVVQDSTTSYSAFDNFTDYQGSLPATEPPAITQSSYNHSTAINDSNATAWRTNLLIPSETYDTTPTIRFDTDIVAYCRIGTSDQNWSEMGDQRNCSTTGATSHVCSLSAADAISAGYSCLYSGCVDSTQVLENFTSTSSCLNVSLLVTNTAPTWTSNISNTSVLHDSGTTTYLTNLSDYATDAEGDSITFSVQSENTSEVDCEIINGSSVSYCYQETANVSTACGGLDTGTYSAVVVDDSVYVNYTKPSTATNNSLWQVKHSNLSVYNVSIPKNCWDFSSVLIMLRGVAVSQEAGETSEAYGQCYNGTGWQTITQRPIDTSGGSGSVGVPSMFWDGNYNTYVTTSGAFWGNDISNEFARFYEEAMYWGIPKMGINLTPSSLYTGVANCTIGINDSTGWGENNTFWIEVTNNAPTWTSNISNTSVVEDSGTTTYLTNLSDYVTDGDSDTITFSVQSENTSEVDCGVYPSIYVYQEEFDEGPYIPEPSYWTDASNMYDADWSDGNWGRATSGTHSYYFNYTVPESAVNTSLWQVASGYGPVYTTNQTLGGSCWNSTVLQFKVTSNQVGEDYVKWYCKEQDGNWLFVVDHGSSQAFVVEEAMWWNISDSTITLTPATNYFGNASCIIGINDSIGYGENRTFYIEVTNVNDAPSFDFNLTNQSANTTSLFIYDINCTDADGDTIIYYSNTSWSAINSSTGLINFTPHEQYTGNTSINITCGDGTLNTSQSFILEINDTTSPRYITSGIENSTRNFCEVIRVNATCEDYSFTLSSTIYYSDNHTRSWVNYTANYLSNDSRNYTFYYDLSAGVYPATTNVSYKFYCVDNYNNTNGSMTEQQFNTTPYTTTTTLYLNDLSADRKYELGTTVHLNGTIDCCTNETVWLDIIDYGYGYNYTSDNYSYVLFNYTKNFTTTIEFNDTTEYKNFSLYFTNYSWVNLQGNTEVEGSKFKIEGHNTSESYPKDVKIDILNDSVIDAIFPNEMRGTYLWTDRFTNNKTSENLSFTSGGTKIRYVNFTANSWLTGEQPTHGFGFNFTFDLVGYSIDLDNVNFDELFYNSSFINSSLSLNATPSYYYDDYSTGEVTDRWNGDHTTYGTGGGSYDEYTVTSDSHIQGTAAASPDDSCTDVWNSQYDEDGSEIKYWFDDSDISDYNEVSFTGYLYTTASAATSCMSSAQRGQWAWFGIRDSSGNHYWFKEITSGASASFGSSQSDTDSDTSSWEIRNEGGYFKIYDDGTYKTQIAIDISKEYYLFGQARGLAVMSGATGGTSIARMYAISYSGYRGEYLNSLTWGNASLVSTRILNATEGNISRAILTADESNTAGGTISYYLSNDNRENWESIQSGVMHTFTNEGSKLFAMINITTTDSETPITVNSYEINVIPGYVSNVTIDVGYDGITNWNYSGKINSTNKQAEIQVSAYDAALYTGENCLNKLTCLIPIAISTSTSGTLEVSNMTFKQNLSYVILNKTVIQNNLSSITTKQDVMINFESNQNGSITITDLVFELKGDDNITVTANYFENENYTFSTDTQYVLWRYSPFNVSYPSGVSSYNVFPSSIDAKGVSPYGQSSSISIWNVTTTALTDPIKIYRWYDSGVDSCLTSYSCLYYNQTNCTIINTTTSTVLIESLNRTQYQNLFDFWNLTNCSGGSLYLPGNFTWRAICKDCVKSW